MEELIKTSCEPGTDVIITNNVGMAVKYRLDCGEYGLITFDAIIGSSFKVKAGSKFPVITMLQADGDSVIGPRED